MSDLIDKQAAYDILSDYYHHRTEIQHKALREALDRVPTVDIIRCKDCRYYHPSFCGVWSSYGTVWVDPDGFCYQAERREDETD